MLQLAPLNLERGAGAALLDRVRAEFGDLALVASRFARAFVVRSPWAPRFCCIGAELALDQQAAAAYGTPRLSVTGNGETMDAALTSCLGEAIDRLAVVEHVDDIQPAPVPIDAGMGFAGTWLSQVLPSCEIDWVEARDALTAEPLLLPADLCLRRMPDRRRIAAVGALSSGVAAGPDLASAALRAGLELCERDAAALWWLGGRRPKAFPIEHAAVTFGAELIQKLRHGQCDRRTLLLDITTDLGIPTIAAVSLDGAGRGLACGLASRLDWEGAARAAILEMCQMELAAPLAEAKRAERGDAGLNEIDRQHLQRAAFAASSCELIHPGSVSDLEGQSATAHERLPELVSRLSHFGVRLLAVDLTRPDLGVAAVRMLSGQLQPYALNVVTERLRQCRVASDRRGFTPVPAPLL